VQLFGCRVFLLCRLHLPLPCNMLGFGVPMLFYVRLLFCSGSAPGGWWSCVAAAASSGVALQYLPVLLCPVLSLPWLHCCNSGDPTGQV
jgi:hypothetical protein